MDILAFMKPTREVVTVRVESSLVEALGTMEKYRFTSVPIIDARGYYVGTLSEGDLLWAIKNQLGFDMAKASTFLVGKIKRNRDYEPIPATATIDQLIGKASNENFVPIVDEDNLLIGIVTRKTLLNYFFEHQFVVL
ncbi:MAG: CBS domain-containing protein [Bacillota bacterium]|nr:CBS domain-containing protein [Bacillota bacterium]